MNKHLHVGITDIIDNVSESISFENELVILNLAHTGKDEDEEDKNKNRRVQIDAFSLILVMEGTMDITINSQNYHIDTKAFIDVFEFHSVWNGRVSTDFRGYHIILTRSFLDEVMRNLKRVPISSFLSRFNHPIMELEDTEAELLELFMLNIIRNIHRTEHVCQRDIIKNEVRNLFAEVINIIIHHSGPMDTDIYKNKEEVISQFIRLVNKHCKEEHSVAFYAEKLCVEAKYLSRILKAASGKTANRFIDEAIITEAKILLKEPDLSIVEITDMLHFSDQSSFGKFFKKHTGLSPLNYKRKLN